MTDLPIEQPAGFAEIVYQQQDTVSRDKPIEVIIAYGEMGYQQQETITETYPIPVEVATLKFVVNILSFVFGGNAYLFDGSSVIGFPSHGEAVIFPMLAFGEDKIVVYGGLREDNTVANDIYVYGQESYTVDIPYDAVALIIAGDEPVYVYDTNGNIKATITTITTVPVLSRWKIASRTSFTIKLMKT